MRQEIIESLDFDKSETDLIIDRNYLVDLVKSFNYRLSFSHESRKVMFGIISKAFTSII
jgi:hypothetical protein